MFCSKRWRLWILLIPSYPHSASIQVVITLYPMSYPQASPLSVPPALMAVTAHIWCPGSKLTMSVRQAVVVAVSSWDSAPPSSHRLIAGWTPRSHPLPHWRERRTRNHFCRVIFRAWAGIDRMKMIHCWRYIRRTVVLFEPAPFSPCFCIPV